MAGVVLGVGLLGCNETSDLDIKFVALEEVRGLTVSAEKTPTALLLIDPRPPSDFARGHLPGAKNVQQSSVMRESELNPQWDPYDRIVVYGDNRGSAPARAMTKRLIEVGYDDVMMYEGGFEEWLAAGLPIELGVSEQNSTKKPAQRSTRD